MSTQVAEQKQSRELKREKEEIKLRALKPDLSTKMVLQNHNIIRDYGKVVIVGPTGVPVADFTICHPMGIHRLPEKTWVMGYSEDIHAGLQRLKDPVQDRIDEDRFKIQVRLLKAARLIKHDEPYEIVWEELNVPYAGWKEPAIARMNAENEKQKLIHEAKFKDFKGQKPKFRPDRDVEKYFSKKEAGFSLQVQKVFVQEDYESLSRTEVPQTFQTEFGKGKKFPQPEIKLGPDFRPDQNSLNGVLDEIQRQIYEKFVEPNLMVRGVTLPMVKPDLREDVERLHKANQSLLKKIRDLEIDLIDARSKIPVKDPDIDMYIEELKNENKSLRDELDECKQDYKFVVDELEKKVTTDEFNDVIGSLPSKVNAI
jgi:FtsZ-binding cell division protein ZapB